MLHQRTIREKLLMAGTGLHSGKQVRLEILPAPEDSGITFVRTDLAPHAEIRASIAHLVDTRLATTLGAGLNGSRATVSTVEHLLAALTGLGIDNATIHVDGPEIPIMDGSAGPFVDRLLEIGIESQCKGKRFLVIKREVRVTDDDKVARIAPGPGLRVTCSLDFDHPLIPTTPFSFDFSERYFRNHLCRARTFGFQKDVEALRAHGLALGGSLENAVVIGDYRVLNPEGLRFADEFVRHKALDAIGDLSLFGMPVIGRVSLHRSGHALNTQLVQAVLADRRAYEIVEPAKDYPATVSHGEASPFAVFEPIEVLA